MKHNYVLKKFTLTPKEQSQIEKRLERLSKFFGDETEAVIKISSERNKEKIEITIFEGGFFYRAEEVDDKVQNALDRAIDIIERQIRKNKTRLQKRLKKDAFLPLPDEEIEDFEEDEISITRIKNIPYKPMSPEEAILQMNLLDHQFFVFLNTETQKVCVAYKRHGNEYGLIVPEE
ncbi:MAG: ribosome-associated translation inhibitor RaiA [Ruminococcaceae bacterium]|nr:ribosome-associated translation inhibitor RaiA [Oscillospiraceae bacterium]